MPRIEVALDDVKEYVDEGWYPVVIVGGEVRESNDKKSQYINWELEIRDPGGEFDGQKFWFNTSLKPQALPMLKRFLEAADFQWDPDGFHIEDVTGHELEVLNEPEEYQDKMQNNITNYRPF